MFSLLESHAPVWDKMYQLLQKERFPQSLLFVGPRHEGIPQFVSRLIAILICDSSETAPCGSCRACHLLVQDIHPDINYIRQEGASGAIKVEQIRELQQNIYQTPQRGLRRFIVIESADKMTISAANALLKILEEPPSHTIFVLIAEQLSSIPATILSRCQKYSFGSLANQSIDYLTIGTCYSPGSPRAELFQHSSKITTELCDVIEEKSSPCTIAAKWSGYVFDDLLWLLYLLTAQAIRYMLAEGKGASYTAVSSERGLMYFAGLTSPVILFNQLEQINAILRKINHNINMNQTLVLENLLLGLIK